MCPKETAAKAKEVIDRAKELIEEAKRGIALMLFSEVIAPHLKEWKMTLRWRMGQVAAADQYGEDIEDSDQRLILLDEKMEEVLEGIDLINNDYHNLLWWVLCEQPGEATNLRQKVVGWYDQKDIPSISGRIIKFKNLKQGDYLYIVNYDNGEIEKAIVKSKPKTSGGMVELFLIADDYLSVTIDPTRTRSDNMFTCYKSAERSLERLFDRLSAHYGFRFKPEPEEIMTKLLA